MRYAFGLFPPLLLAVWAVAGEPSQPKVVPVTRPEMKEALEALKKSKPRLPLPPLSEAEKEKLGGRSPVNNGRMRALYLPPELRGGDFVREPDPNITLDRTFKTMLFWIVSRGNNCQYCLGHQEWKLASDGLSEERIAALDCDWGLYTPAEQAAFELARRLTFEPHTFTAAHLDPLRKHYKDVQILELILSVANNNATNRWTDGLAIPQDGDGAFFAKGKGEAPAVSRSFLTPTAEKYKDRPSQIAPTQKAEQRRPPLPTRAEVEAALAACRKREPRLPLADEAQARAVLPEGWSHEAVPQWVRLLANFPKAGKARVVSYKLAEEKGNLSPKLKAQVAWVAARQDRAWYALGHARQRLLAQGFTEDAIYALDGPWDRFTDGERAALSLARKLTATPDRVTDADVAAVRKHYGDREVAELVHHVCLAAFFDRLTEASGLRLEK
jgi:alkylhydroperoxidase family enzyme